jgi:hypothetical protein
MPRVSVPPITTSGFFSAGTPLGIPRVAVPLLGSQPAVPHHPHRRST